MVATTPLDEPYVGKRFAECTFTVDDTVLNSYYAGLALVPRPDAALPSTLVSKPDNDYIVEAAYSNRFGHLWVRQAWQFERPLERGSTHGIQGEIRDIYQRRDRNVVQFETRVLDAQGEVSATSQHHQSFLRNPEVLREVALRDPGKKPGARKFEIPVGERFGGLEREITAQMCGEFFHGKANYHTDIEASKALGFKDIVVGGRMTMAYAAHVLEERFGDVWPSSGHIDVKFTNPVWVDDTVTARGVVTGSVPGHSERIGAFVWVTRSDGAVVVVGTASVARS